MATGLSVRTTFKLNDQGLEHPFPCRSTEGFSPKYFIGEADHDHNGKQPFSLDGSENLAAFVMIL
jgi:hypothetical protein